MPDYRWNQLDYARGYDAAASCVHPYYREIQQVILEHLPLPAGDTGWLVDLGGGSGRLAELMLERWPAARVCVLDQSEAFLTLAAERLRRFGKRVVCLPARLQSDWSRELPEPPRAFVSMSAIHHLDANEKRCLYQRCANCLADGGVLLNGDEVRPERDEDYLNECRRWAAHMEDVLAAGQIPESFQAALRGWQDRNVRPFGTPRVSGDDCHETAAVQLAALSASGLRHARVVWQRDLWAVLFARKDSAEQPTHGSRSASSLRPDNDPARREQTRL